MNNAKKHFANLCINSATHTFGALDSDRKGEAPPYHCMLPPRAARQISLYTYVYMHKYVYIYTYV